MKKRYIHIFILFVLLTDTLCSPAQQSKVIDSLKHVFVSTKNDTVKIKTLIQISQRCSHTNFEQAFNYALKALEISKNLKQREMEGLANREIGKLYVQKGDYATAASYYFRALEIDKDLKNFKGEATDYDLIADIYVEQRSFDLALEYYKKSLLINKRLGNKKEMSVNYNNVGIVYITIGKYENAVDCFNQALELSLEIGNAQGVAATYMNKSIVFYKKGALSLAINNMERGIEIELKLGDSSSLLKSYTNLAELYLESQDLDNGMLVLQKAEKYVTVNPDKDYLRNLYENYNRLYRAQANYKSAVEYGRKALRLKDTIYKDNNSRLAIEITARFESTQKKQEIDNLTKDADLAGKALKQQRNFKIILFIFGLLSAGFSVVLVRRILRKRKTNKTLSKVYAQIEKKNQSITDSINYSKRIQESILPSKKLKSKLFHESFIIFLPKDIVSGDFYWYTEKDGKKIVACCDCTGHGVPGSLMSMISNNILNQVVNENEITSPDEILNHLHREMRKALKQDVQSKSMDGMDLALIVFNSDTEIEYAGAHRPLWIVKKQTPEAEVELVEIKANKFSIGGYQAEEERTFTKHTVSLKKGDCIYMSTDGYADQFGGPEGKKFMTKRLKELLISNYSKTIAEQEKNITDTIIAWKGDYEQVDDIQMIGIRI